MQGIMLFTKSSITDSDEFAYPNIHEVKSTIEGAHNIVYSQGIPKSSFYDEAKRFFNMVDILQG